MFEFLHQADLADCRTRRALFAVEMDLFQRHEGSCLAITAFEYLFVLWLANPFTHEVCVHVCLTVAYVPSPNFSSC